MGLRMDIDSGTMTVYKNGRRLGLAFAALQDSQQFRGEFLCFAAAMFDGSAVEINLRPPKAGTKRVKSAAKFDATCLPSADVCCEVQFVVITKACDVSKRKMKKMPVKEDCEF